MRNARIFSILGGLLAVVSLGLPWFEAENLVREGSFDGIATGVMLPDGISAAVVGLVALIAAVVSMFRRAKRALIINDVIAGALIFSFLWHAFWDAPAVLSAAWEMRVEPDEWIMAGLGYYLTLLGGVLITLAAAVAYGARPEYDMDAKVLRVESRWHDSIIREEVYLEPEIVTVGDQLRCSFVVPESPERRFILLKPDVKGREYTLFLTREMQGQLSIGGQVYEVGDYVKEKTSDVSGPNPVVLDDADFGVLRFGEVELVFRFVRPEQQIVRMPFWKVVDRQVAASVMFSMLFQLSFLSWTLLSWDETAERSRRDEARQMLQVAVEVEEIEEELLDMGEEEDTVGKQAAGEEGKFGDPEEDKKKESKVPKRDGKMVDKIDPKKVGLNDLLSSNSLMGENSALSNIMSADSGFTNKLAIAMSGTGTEFAMGYGSGGLGFKGTGTGGGGSGYGRIHGLGKIDTGGGAGVKAGLGKKGMRKVGKFKLGSGQTAGFCAKRNITEVVRRRAGAIRACYEDRLQVKPNMSGKVTVRWRIELDGKVGSANVLKSSLGDAKVESCVLRTIRRMRFQKPEGGVCIIQWPFVFRNN